MKEFFPGHSQWFEGLMFSPRNKQCTDHAEVVFHDFFVSRSCIDIEQFPHQGGYRRFSDELSMSVSLRMHVSECDPPFLIALVECRIVIIQTIVLEMFSSVRIVIKDWHQGEALVSNNYVSIILFLVHIGFLRV